MVGLKRVAHWLLVAVTMLVAASCRDDASSDARTTKLTHANPGAHGSQAPSIPVAPPPTSRTLGRTREVYVAELGTSLSVFPTVFAPHRTNQPFRQFLVSQDLAWAKHVLDIGTGSGVLSFLVLRRGAGRVVATDVNDVAIQNASHNAERLGYEGKFEARLVPLDRPDAFSMIGPLERFDLILSNPPWFNGFPRSMKDRAIYDEGYSLLRSILAGLPTHLKHAGKAWLEYSSDEAREVIVREAPRYGLTQRILRDQGPYAIIELRLRPK